MRLEGLLDAGRARILEVALQGMRRRRLPGYERAGPDATRARFEQLFDLVRDCIAGRQLSPMVEYGQRLAHERFDAGYDLLEVQAAFNALEESVWQAIIHELAPADYAEALGLVSTVLGAGKDALACTYVALASKDHARTLDLGALFAGTEGPAR